MFIRLLCAIFVILLIESVRQNRNALFIIKIENFVFF